MKGMSAPAAATDRQLLAAARDGDAEAFGRFYRRYQSLVLAYARKRTSDPEVAADVTAEVFAAALIAVHRGSAVDLDSPGAWLLRVARNKLVDSYRNGQVDAAARRELGLDPLALHDSDIERIHQSSNLGTVAMALARDLPPDQWEAIEARIVEERDYDDVARSLGLSEFVVRKRVSRGLARLRNALQGQE
jgi:RNA polymerase sigma-70 factor (ECF subfamily)